MRYQDQEGKVYRANHSLHVRRNAKENKDFNREAYNHSVSNAHQYQAAEHERVKAANESRIK